MATNGELKVDTKDDLTASPKGKKGTPNAPWKKLFSSASYDERMRLEESLRLVVTNSESPSSVLVGETSLALSSQYLWLSHFIPAGTLDKLFAENHLGNYVIVRQTGDKVFETMPIYARIGMHLLFHGPLQIRILRWGALRRLLKAESTRQGRIYDSTDPEIVRTQIAAFVTTYEIDVAELLEPDLQSYKTFNQFFSRRLKPEARPPASPDDPSIIVSAADCRLTVWPNWKLARKIWVKGRHFTLSSLLKDRKLTRCLGKKPSLAIFRLAPQDYHRFHSPVSGTLQSITHIDGEYYTVNPQAVNEKLDVLTGNVREVAALSAQVSSVAPHVSEAAAGSNTAGENDKVQEVPIAVVAVGALLVGSVGWDKVIGESVTKGDGLGHFQYGGSTVVCVFPGPDVAGAGMGMQWDDDLLENSEGGLETLVRAGERIGRFVLETS